MRGLDFYPFKAETVGLGYYQIGDRLTLKDPASNAFECIIFGIVINLSGGFQESLSAKLPAISSTNYDFAGIIGKAIKDTQIIVDKQAGTIAILTSDVNGNIASINVTLDAITTAVNQAIAASDINADDIASIQSLMTTLTQTADALSLSVSGQGGSNLLKNSVGLKGDIKDWQVYDTSNVLVDATNSGTIDQSTDIINNTESGSAIIIAEQNILQTVPTIAGKLYTIYFRYKNSGTLNLNITGAPGTINPPDSADWAVFKYQFTATTNSTTLKLSNGSGATATISDIVEKLGDINGWIQAPNEVYGKNYRFDKEGFLLTDPNSTFKALLTNTSLTVYDTSSGSDKIVMQVSKDAGKITSLIAQDELVVQRYENSSKALRLKPTDRGAMLVIND
jgi:hypothetical protein